MAPGLRHPKPTPASEANLSDDAEVIGVTVNGASRAYALAGMSHPLSHVVNDVLEDLAVTVTYCDRRQCARVFTSAKEVGPLDMSCVGWIRGELLVGLKGRNYAQTAKDLPLDQLEFVRTTWKDWREAHPETDVFLGRSSEDDAPESAAAQDPEAKETSVQAEPGDRPD